MRLWHYKLIPVLPKAMLISQWRECIAIKRQWEKGTLKHRLVSYVMEHSKEYFIEYVWLVQKELGERNIKTQYRYYEEIYKFCENDIDEDGKYLLYPEHNDRYLKQCLYNLEEKATRNIISKEEWLKIYNEFKDFTDLWDGE